VNPGSLVEVTQFVTDLGGHLNLAGGCLEIGGGSCETIPSVGEVAILSADTVWVGEGTVFDSTSVALGAAGVLGGSGSLPFDITNAGTINPGDSAGVAGTFTIGGAYTQDPAGVLEVELAGASNHDVLAVAGAATLDGVLRFRYVGGFTPAPGDAFEVLSAGTVSGSFASVEGPAGSTYSLDYGPTTVTATVLTVANEPPAGSGGLVLHPPAPNPITGRALLRYELPAAGPTRLVVHDAVGREVAVLVGGEVSQGRHEALLDTARLESAVYIMKLTSGGRTVTRRFAIAR
jgi:hypothetical protein